MEGEPKDVAPRHICAWACITCEDMPEPVIGVYVDEARRGRGIAERLVAMLMLLAKQVIPDDTENIYAVSKRWEKYKRLVEAAGYELKEWD